MINLKEKFMKILTVCVSHEIVTAFVNGINVTPIGVGNNKKRNTI